MSERQMKATKEVALPIVMAYHNVFGEKVRKRDPRVEVSATGFYCTTEQLKDANRKIEKMLRYIESAPENYERVEAYIGKGEIVVIGYPAESDDEETGHNCDAMGCSSVSHVIYRERL